VQQAWLSRLTQVGKEIRVATRCLTENVSIRLHDGVKPFLYGIRTVVSSFLASCTELLSSNEADEGTNGRCDSTHEGNYGFAIGILELVQSNGKCCEDRRNADHHQPENKPEPKDVRVRHPDLRSRPLIGWCGHVVANSPLGDASPLTRYA
jgi:hypothetical protein